MAELELLDGVAGVAPDEWNALVGDDSPFLEWEWLASLEESGAVGGETGWLAKPLVARREGRVVAAAPLYLKTHSEGEFVFDWGWADAAERAGIAYYPKLLVGVPFTPVAGARFLSAPGEDRRAWSARLAAALRELCVGNQLSGVHVNFCREDEIEPARGSGFLLRVGIQYHWESPGYADFEGWLARLRHKRRNQIRRERRALAEDGVSLEVLSGSELGPEWAALLFRFYRATVDRNPWGRRYLTARFFELLLERFRHRLAVVVARREGRPIAATLNVVKGSSFYGRYWGCERDLPNLHFDVCYYAAIEYCIRQEIRRFEPGAGGEHKRPRGFDARPTFSLHFLADPRLARAVEEFLEAERAEAQHAIDALREQSAYKAEPT